MIPSLIVIVLLWMPLAAQGISQDRVVAFVPLTANSATFSSATSNSVLTNSSPSLYGNLPNLALATNVDAAWSNYLKLWSAHHQQPGNTTLRKFLDLSNDESPAKMIRGRAAPRWLGWQAASYHQIDTPHFQIFSRAEPQFTQSVAADVERFYWVWTQLFFPFWEGQRSVQSTFEAFTGDNVAEHLEGRPGLKSNRPRMRIVIFADSDEYQRTLARDEPAVAQSTGFYSDMRQTTFLYGGVGDDTTPTRHHELTHQMFREATFSRLGTRSPGEQSDFWLVEGIAGYMESLSFIDNLATVGGWNSERLQYARYRILVGGDSMPLSELRADGRIAAQRRSDLSRYYAHAITQTHFLLDGGVTGSRQWVFNTLADLYRIEVSFPLTANAPEDPRLVTQFLAVNDQTIVANAKILPPTKICLAGCEVSSEGLAAIPASTSLTWLDLSRMPSLKLTDIMRLCPEPNSLTTLSLEATRLEPESLAIWLGGATSLRELDLSSTAMDDHLIEPLSQMREIDTLWLTGSHVSDKIIDVLLSLSKLRSVDLQQCAVSDDAIARLRAARPDLQLNPLQIR